VPESSLRRVAAGIDERVDAALPAELVGAVSLGIAMEDWTATAVRLALRSAALGATVDAARMQGGMIAVADLHSVSLMQAFHTGQPVQPVTFGHLLGGAIGPVGEGIARLEAAVGRLNRSPLGAGTMSGEVVGGERVDTASWLGFDGPIPNTYDAVTNVEDIVATLDAAAAVAAPVARMLDELATLVRTDPQSIVFSDDWMREDARLPGFSAAEGLVSLAGDLRAVTAASPSLVARLRGLPYGPIGAALDWIDRELPDLILRAGEVFLCVETLFRAEMTVNRAYLANRAGRGYTTSNDLAAFLMTEEQLPPSVARNIASLAMRRLREENAEMSAITPEMVDTAAMMVIGRELKVEMETLGRWFAPRRFLERRLVEGSPAPSKTRAWLEQEAARNRRASDALAARGQRVREAEASLRRWLEERASEPDE
jgi:argininosuccinate lyase